MTGNEIVGLAVLLVVCLMAFVGLPWNVRETTQFD